MTFTPHGRHLVAGEWLAVEGTFRSAPAWGPAHLFSAGTVDLVNRACEAAEAAFPADAATRREDRARVLDAIAGQIEARAEAITAIGAGQFCSNPGLMVMPRGALADAFAATAAAAAARVAPRIMLTDTIAKAYRNGADRAAGVATPACEAACPSQGRNALPAICNASAEAFLRDDIPAEEAFGPMGIIVPVPVTVIVTVAGADQMLDLASALGGQLTASLHLDDADPDLARRLMPVLEPKAGRILASFGATSVGTMAIRRFLRPVCYQDIPDALLPEDLREPA